MVARHNLALALLRGSGPYGDKFDPQAVAAKHGRSTPQTVKRFLVDLFLEGNLDTDVYESIQATASSTTDTAKPEDELRRLAYAIVTLPEFQLA